MLVSIDYVDAEKGIRLGSEPIHEPFTDNLGELYRFGLREFGRCTGHVYIGEGIPVGWVFVKLVEFDDADSCHLRGRDRYFLRESWVTLHAEPISVTRTEHYLNVKTGRAV
jgi:hypothetical protein